ncbi:radical SAM family heme chaperone HemW [Thermoclostridium stercorarium]|uniref:radical SAM family heme chaperone HemW n=1 Tax=Thermoclostridium stercorarium TaxID=1510 RepID=UPI000AC57AB8|nr:radical SAM family heme chaperone HemW [Thermoclostridium stercorarium]
MLKDKTLGIYVHIPFCIRKCNYCDFPSYPGLDAIFRDYTRAVCREIETVASKHSDMTVDTIFFGGGTPSVLPADCISDIMNSLSANFEISEDAEISIEINPGTITGEKAEAYRKIGFNRASIGLQSASNNLLRFMGRIHTEEMFEECVKLLKGSGFHNINADVIFGVPTQTMEDWQETVELVLEKGVTHVSAYSLKIEEGTPWHELNERGKLPAVDEDLEREMYYWVIKKLKDAGFRHYEISNFAKPGFECRHNLKYWTNRPYLGFGSAAHSYIDDVRYSNEENPCEYIGRIAEGVLPVASSEYIGAEEKLSERFILGLRLVEGVSLKDLEREFGSEALKKYDETIRMLVGKNLLCFENDMLRLPQAWGWILPIRCGLSS